MSGRSGRSFGLAPVLCIGAVVCALSAGVYLRLVRQPQPSVILIVVDTLRSDFLRIYGFDGPTSPTIDRLAADSAVFSHMYTPAPWTTPAVASLMTSLEPQVHGLTNHEGKFWTASDSQTLKIGILPGQAFTLAEAFRSGGYATAAFVANPWLKRMFGFDQGFDVYEDSHASNTTAGRLLFESARSWLQNGRPEGAPFFLYLHFMDVHGPYLAPEEDLQAVQQSPGLGSDRLLLPAEMERIPRYLLGAPWTATTAGSHLHSWRAHYAAGVHFWDRQFESFLADLYESGLLAHTALVVTADHGEELLNHGRWGHGNTLYNYEIAVPLVVRMPGTRGQARRINAPASLLDVMPTLVALAGIPAPEGLQGRNLLPLLEGGGRWSDERPLVATATKHRPALFALIQGEYKLITNQATGANELYHLTDDPGETQNLASRQTAIVRRLQKELRNRIELSAAHPGLDGSVTTVDEATREALERLGYVNQDSSDGDRSAGDAVER